MCANMPKLFDPEPAIQAKIEYPSMECAVNEQIVELDQVDEDILSYTASDAALEAAAGMQRGR
jgi:hypothetical protein